MDSIVNDFHLNTEQEHAFHVVANNLCYSFSEQLKMHIGGMGGTGKSQVLKALMKIFELKKESHWFVVVAPTGSAAALLGGSTYHYMFGINDFKTGSKAVNLQLAEVKQRLQGMPLDLILPPSQQFPRFTKLKEKRRKQNRGIE
ncbi:hypothetical protein L208DRAFT_1318003 [Tricholoma matsutake]|nr:hypothetical protein L208DRAFT_1318003 [Tricholoma matsutake 945]